MHLFIQLSLRPSLQFNFHYINQCYSSYICTDYNITYYILIISSGRRFQIYGTCQVLHLCNGRYVPPFFYFTITLGRTLLLRLKTSSSHLSGNKWITPTYNPDLAPSDYHLFLHLKKFLGGKRFNDDDDLKDAVQNWLTS
jgi:hypothetical protein